MSASCPNRWTATTAENVPRASSRDSGSIVRNRGSTSMKTGRWPAATMALTSEGSVNKGRATPDPGFRSSAPSSSRSACRPLRVQNFGLSPSSPNVSGGGAPRKIARNPAAKSAGV